MNSKHIICSNCSNGMDQSLRKSKAVESYGIPLCRCTIPVEICNDEYPVNVCQAVSSVLDKRLACGNLLPSANNSGSNGIPLLRAHVRCPFQALCTAHTRLLRLHFCCPCCGIFCLHGEFNRCDGALIHHWFHKDCLSLNDSCPHCLSTNFSIRHVNVYTEAASIENHWSKPRARMTGVSINSTKIARKRPLHKFFSIPSSELAISAGTLLEDEERTRLQAVIEGIDSGLKFCKHTSIAKAIKANDLYSVCHMIVTGEDVHSKFQGEFPLHLAVQLNSPSMVYVLLEAGTNPNELNDSSKTALWLAVEKDLVRIVHILLQLNADPNIRTDEETNGLTILHLASRRGHCSSVDTLARCFGSDVNARDEFDWTPLVYAAENGHCQVTRTLVDRGADVMIPDLEGNVALHWAAAGGSDVLIRILLSRMSPDCLDVTNVHSDTALHIACRKTHWDVAILLVEQGANGHLKNDISETAQSLAQANREAPSLLMNLLRISQHRGQQRLNRRRSVVSRDISRGHESVPIQAINEMDNEYPSTDFTYVVGVYESGSSCHEIDRRINMMTACKCSDDCTSNCLCAQWAGQISNYQDGVLSDELDLLLVNNDDVLTECSPACRCSAKCRNRVAQRAIQVRLELFKTVHRGWGVRTLQRLLKGTFICEYAGEILTSKVADDRIDDTYLFEIESDGHNHCIDASQFGNVSRFVNHSCEANLLPLKVLWDHPDIHYPHICLFAKRDIPPGAELTFDYGDKFWQVKIRHFLCSCDSASCRYGDDYLQKTINSDNSDTINVTVDE